MFLVDRGLPQQIRRGRSRHRENTMLTMDEAAADVDRGTQEPLNTEGIEPNCRPYGVDNGIYGPDLMELNIFRRNMMDLSFRNGQLAKNIARDPLCVRIEVTVTDHRQNLRRFPLKVLVVVMMMPGMVFITH